MSYAIIYRHRERHDKNNKGVVENVKWYRVKQKLLKGERQCLILLNLNLEEDEEYEGGF